MTNLQLRLAAEVGRSGSISTAAELLGVSQPNASSSIRKLEQELGCKLFERNRNGVVPTEQGIRFLDHAKKILEEYDAIETISNTEKLPRLRVSILNYKPALNAFTDYLQEQSEIQAADFTCTTASVEESVQMLIDRNLDYVVTFMTKSALTEAREYADRENLSLNVLKELPVCIHLRTDHPLLVSGRLDPSNLQSYYKLNHYPYVRYTRVKLPKSYITAASMHFGCSYCINIEDRETRKEVISRTNAYSVGVPFSKEDCERYHIVNIPVGDEKSCLISANRRGEDTDQQLERFTALLKKRLENAEYC